MTISTAPIASGASAPAVATAMPMVKTRKNVPTNSTASLRSMGIAAPWLGCVARGGYPSAHPELVEHGEPEPVGPDVADPLGDDDHRPPIGQRDGGREVDDAPIRCGPGAAIDVSH